MKKESSGAGATLMKTRTSEARAGAIFMKTSAPEPEMCHFYDGSAALIFIDMKTKGRLYDGDERVFKEVTLEVFELSTGATRCCVILLINYSIHRGRRQGGETGICLLLKLGIRSKNF